MIRLWLSRRTATPVHDQLASQFILGILSGRLQPGERLPSIRSLARRLQLHPNTISAVYSSLASAGWVTQRRGSGVFVRQSCHIAPGGGIDAFARSCLDEAIARGYSPHDLLQSFHKWLHPLEDKFLVVDSDGELACILAAEIGEAIGRVVPFASSHEAGYLLEEATCALVTGRFARTHPEALRTCPSRTIQLKAMQDVLLGHRRPSAPILLGVVSNSTTVLRWASILLSALGFSPDALVLRNVQRHGWRDGLHACHLVAADIVSAQEFEDESKVVRFRIVADEFLAELSGLALRSRETSRRNDGDQDRS